MLQPKPDTLYEAIVGPTPACVALIGGGGKTTTMLRLAREAQKLGLRTVVTTTTRIWPPDDVPCIVQRPGQRADCLRDALDEHGLIAVGAGVSDVGKVLGVDPLTVCDMLSGRVAELVLCEADGSAGRPIKVHGSNEPVVPACASVVVVVAGMDAVGRPTSPDTIHRFDPYIERFGHTPGETITQGRVASVLAGAAERIPRDAAVVFLLNKCDTPERLAHAEHVACLLGDRVAGATVVSSSNGRVVAMWPPKRSA